jgi:hypothetical protein
MTGMTRGFSVVLLAAFGGCVLLTCLLFGSWWLDRAPVPGAGELGPEKVYSREQLERRVRGKSVEEVRALLGPPDFTGNPGSDAVAGWGYRYLTVDDRTTTLDVHTYLWFENQRVTEVRYTGLRP